MRSESSAALELIGGSVVARDVSAEPWLRVTARRFERLLRFATVGASGTVLNLAIMAVLMHRGMHYVLASVIAIEITIVTNFLLQERFVFRDHRAGAQPLWARFASSLGFNNAEAAIKVPVLIGLVELLSLHELLAQAVVLTGAFFLRFLFTSRVIYRVPLLARP
jgi:dolichol-phosphate mannosyltransferase